MWAALVRVVSARAPYVVLPFAALVGVVGYFVEGLVSDKYTPYDGAVQERRFDRLTDDVALADPTQVSKLEYKENVFAKNLSPSLKPHPPKL